MTERDRSWTDMAAETTAAVGTFAANEEVLALLAGAVFALHQDSLRAFAIDMARADDTAQAAAIDAAQPTPLGGFDARLRRCMDTLRSIEHANVGVLSQPPPAGLSAEAAYVHLLLARLRLTAARLWLMTMQARAGDDGGAGLKVGVSGLWARLQTVPRDAIAAVAANFTGTFYAGIRSEPMDVAAWPFSP